MKTLLLAGVCLAAWVSVGCSGTQTYITRHDLMGNVPVRTEAKVVDDTLETETDADGYPIERVRLRLADGQVIEPTFSTVRTYRRGGGSGVSFGVGSVFGTGGGSGVGVGVGTGRGYDRDLIQVREARFAGIDLERQPFTLLIGIESDPPLTLETRLAHNVAPADAPAKAQDADDDVRTFKLPDGTTASYRLSQMDDRTTIYAPIAPVADQQ
ncbi:MAG: hypothetical protein GVY24_01310 [Planctomycetes bacterium]|jgi:hypothetical protein|nr:hypothetical protein [Planctomycetota bacterium]